MIDDDDDKQYWNDIPGNINQEEFVEIFLQIFEGEDTGEPKTT